MEFIVIAVSIFENTHAQTINTLTIDLHLDHGNIISELIQTPQCFPIVKHCYLRVVSNDKKYRRVKTYGNYFNLFFSNQRIKVKEKILWTLELIEDIEHVPEKYLKHLTGTDGLYEIRVQQGTDIFRIFCFFDSGDLVILMNGFQKKTRRTPRNLIKRALNIKKQYVDEKE